MMEETKNRKEKNGSEQREERTLSFSGMEIARQGMETMQLLSQSKVTVFSRLH